jgi:hypothetical protein
LKPWEIGRLTPGQIEDMVMYERAYAHNAAALVGYHSMARTLARHRE